MPSKPLKSPVNVDNANAEPPIRGDIYPIYWPVARLRACNSPIVTYIAPRSCRESANQTPRWRFGAFARARRTLPVRTPQRPPAPATQPPGSSRRTGSAPATPRPLCRMPPSPPVTADLLARINCVQLRGRDLRCEHGSSVLYSVAPDSSAASPVSASPCRRPQLPERRLLGMHVRVAALAGEAARQLPAVGPHDDRPDAVGLRGPRRLPGEPDRQLHPSRVVATGSAAHARSVTPAAAPGVLARWL